MPLNFRIELVQTAAVEYMVDSLQIGVHFDAFRKYLLLEDGEFGLSLCNQIFEKVIFKFILCCLILWSRICFISLFQITQYDIWIKIQLMINGVILIEIKEEFNFL